MSKRCAVCGDRIVGVEDALEHYLNNHPHADLLHEVLSSVTVWSECAECGNSMTGDVSIGIDAEADAGILTVPSNCSACIDDDPFSEIFVEQMSPGDVIDQEVPDDEVES